MVFPHLLQDLRYTFRTLRRDAGFAVFAILIAGLGIGASATVFSVVNTILLRPLPFERPSELVWIANSDAAGLSGQTTQVGYMLDLRETVELACGHGRHAERVAPLAGRLTLIDIHEENLEACRARLRQFDNVSYLRNEGFDYQPLPAGSTTAIYCYDAMVHFSADLVASYLADTARVLARSGMALYHHSNYDRNQGLHYGENPHARNSMSIPRFRALAEAAGLEVVRSVALDWGNEPDLDGLTLVRKP